MNRTPVLLLTGFLGLGIFAQTTNRTDVSAALAPETDEIDLEEIDDSADAAKRPTVKANERNGEDDRLFVDIDCDDAPLADVLRQFRKTTGANIISADSSNLQSRVSVSLVHVPWLTGLQAILNSRNFRIEPRDGIYFVSEDKTAEPVFVKTFTLNHASATDLAKLFNASFGRHDANGKLLSPMATPFPGANTVVVTSSEKTLAECAQIIARVDRPVLQAYIEARFVELDAGATRKLGVKWDALANGWTTSVGPLHGGGTLGTAKVGSLGKGTALTGGQKPAGSDSGTPDLAYKNAWGIGGEMSVGELNATLQAIEQMDNATTFSNPKIIVANEHKARVDMTTKFPNVRVTASRTTQSGSTSMDISAAIETIPGENALLFAREAFYAWGITLDVTPRISQDGLITVDIVPTISQLSENSGYGDEGFYKVATSEGDNATPYSKYPIIEVKRIESQFTMKSGSTAVIGGLSKTVDSTIETGIPWLREIPWIGPRLFGWKSRVKTQKEIIIFVTVGVANPEALPADIGLPKNAVIAREFVEGRKLEPGDAGIESTVRIPGVHFQTDAAATPPTRGTVTIRAYTDEERENATRKLLRAPEPAPEKTKAAPTPAATPAAEGESEK